MLTQIKQSITGLEAHIADLKASIEEAEKMGGLKVGDELTPVKEPAASSEPVTKTCPACAGTGLDSRHTETMPMKCEKCDGTAFVKAEPAPAAS